MQEESLRRLALGTVAILVVMFLVGARGSSANQASGSMTEVQIILSDFKIESPQNTFSIDRPYRFVIKNEGTQPCAWVIMPRGKTDTDQALLLIDEGQLQPGAAVTEELVFAEAGHFELVCNVPGHYEAGMLLSTTVQ